MRSTSLAGADESGGAAGVVFADGVFMGGVFAPGGLAAGDLAGFGGEAGVRNDWVGDPEAVRGRNMRTIAPKRVSGGSATGVATGGVSGAGA